MLNKIKWLATAVLIVGTAVNGMGYYPAGPLILVLGGLIWLGVAVKVQDRPLIVTNLVMSTVGLAAVLYSQFYMLPDPELPRQSAVDREIECRRMLNLPDED